MDNSGSVGLSLCLDQMGEKPRVEGLYKSLLLYWNARQTSADKLNLEISVINRYVNCILNEYNKIMKTGGSFFNLVCVMIFLLLLCRGILR